MNADERQCLERLEAWAKKIDTLLQVLGEKPRLIGAEATRAKALYREIKDGLRGEYRQGASLRGNAALTDAERRWYHPAIHEAYVHLYAPLNSTPGPAWSRSLAEASMDLTHMASQLRHYQKAREPQ